MQISKKLKKVLIIVLLPFLSLSAEKLENLSELKAEQESLNWRGWAWSSMGVFHVSYYLSKNFIDVPKVQEDLRENRIQSLYLYSLNSSFGNSIETTNINSWIIFKAISDNEILKDDIHSLKANYDHYLGLGVLQLLVGFLNFKNSYEIKQEILKKESVSLSFTPQVGFNVNRDSMQVNLIWRF